MPKKKKIILCDTKLIFYFSLTRDYIFAATCNKNISTLRPKQKFGVARKTILRRNKKIDVGQK